ncbi:MAG: DegT/DnrJ/EryC1/StrS family aminotransferase [Actinomycetota bacterium]
MAITVPTPGARAPAILGGHPLFAAGLPLARPRVPNAERIAADVGRILASGILTNGPYVRRLEETMEEYLGVQHCVAVSSCTSGLMLLLRAADLSGDVVLPSFTFAATAHAVAWNGLRPVFADIDPETLTLSPIAASHATGMRTSAILATHLYGAPCDIEGLTELARRSGVRLFFDAAHAFGARHGDDPVGGFGDAEVFSLSPTKPVVASEGGIIATNDDEIAERCRIGRDYANPGDYDCLFVGLNARMSEIHAALALASMEDLDERTLRRNELARRYHEVLGAIPGLDFPRIAEGDVSTFKDFTILVDAEEFGLRADRLAEALAAEGIETRRYYSPPVHRMRAYRSVVHLNGALAVTDEAAERVLTLPMFDDMSDDAPALVAQAIVGIRDHLAVEREGT